MWDRKELKKKGMAAFKANFWKCVLVAFLLTLFVAGTSASTSRVTSQGLNSNNSYSFSVSSDGDGNVYMVNNESYDSLQDAVSAVGAAENMNPESVEAINEMVTAIQTDPEVRTAMGMVMAMIGGTLLLIAVIAVALRILVFNPIEVGCRGFFSSNTKAPAELDEMKVGFHPYGRTVGTMFLRDLFISLWSLLFVIPGIIKSYSYRMVPYILAENPEIKGKEAIDLSRKRMDGQKWNTFVLGRSFIGWDLLSCLTLGLLGLFYVNPYKYSTGAELYQVLKNK